jgi:hypothetical protein
MKQYFTLIILLLMTLCSNSQTPQSMSYQAVVRDNNNNLITEQTVGMQISILQGSTAGTAVYVETHTTNSNSNGLVTLIIGTGNTNNNFESIDWSSGPYFIKTDTDLEGGSNYTITATSQLLSVPYALHANTAQNVAALPSGEQQGELLIWSGVEWNTLPIGSNGQILQIINGVPTWRSVVQYDDPTNTFDDVTLSLSELFHNRAKIRAQIDFGTSLSAEVTELALLVSQESNPLQSNSSYLPFSINNINDFGDSDVNINNLQTNTTYYYRLIVNNLYVDTNVQSFTTNPVALGQPYQGGILAYVLQPNDNGYISGEFHGFVVAEVDLDNTAPWGCEGTNIPGMVTGGSPGTTQAQNTAIINGCNEPDIAAKLCANWTHNGYSDWLLPSKDLINNGIRKSEVFNNLSGFTNNFYWSCTPHSNNPANTAWATNIISGSNIQSDKSNTYHIRPVRQF